MNVRLVIYATILATNVATADQSNTMEIVAGPNQAIVQVNGIVCSFCAYGAEKNLAKLSFLDASQFGNDGVLIDIRSHRITLALQPDQDVDLVQVYNAIKKGGYDPVSFYVNVHGRVQKDGNRYLLSSSHSGQVFEILGEDAGRLVEGSLTNVKGQVDAGDVEAFNVGKPIPMLMTSSESF